MDLKWIQKLSCKIGWHKMIDTDSKESNFNTHIVHPHKYCDWCQKNVCVTGECFTSNLRPAEIDKYLFDIADELSKINLSIAVRNKRGSRMIKLIRKLRCKIGWHKMFYCTSGKS